MIKVKSRVASKVIESLKIKHNIVKKVVGNY